MKISALVLSILAVSPAAFAKQPVAMEQRCETAIKTAAAVLQNGYVNADETSGAVTVDGADVASVSLSNVQILSSSCQGPADCDSRHPDSFTYAADIGAKGQGLTGKVVVSYHRGNCFVKKITLGQ